LTTGNTFFYGGERKEKGKKKQVFEAQPLIFWWHISNHHDRGGKAHRMSLLEVAFRVFIVPYSPPEE